MEKDYLRLVNNIQKRYNPEEFNNVKQRTFSELTGESKDTAKYVRAAMMEVDDTYTSKTLAAGDRVKQQLNQQQNGISYEYQGSVMTQTHIKGFSDIDLLTLTNDFCGTDIVRIRRVVKENPSQFTYQDLCRLQNYDRDFAVYQGDGIQVLRNLRLDNERILNAVYTHCDISKPKSIRVHYTEYNRDVDVVTASWYQSMEYVLRQQKEYQGINIYNKEDNNIKDPDFPFLSIKRINERSTLTSGRLKKMIRFLKNVRTDADKKIDLTSFEINAVCYDIPILDYEEMYYLDLVHILWSKMHNLCQSQEQLNNLKSVTGTEFVFKNKPEKVQALRLLEDEVWSIDQDLKDE